MIYLKSTNQRVTIRGYKIDDDGSRMVLIDRVRITDRSIWISIFALAGDGGMDEVMNEVKKLVQEPT